MDIPAQAHAHPYGGWPANELEEVLAASLGVDSAGGRIVEVLGRSQVWIPLPQGGGPGSANLDLPTLEIEGQAYVPVFSSEEQFLAVVGDRMGCTVAPAVEFARGLPPQVGIAVNPDGAVGVPLPPPSPSCASPAVRRWTGPPRAAGSASTSPTGRTTRSTSWPPCARSSRPPVSS
jgi:hypothetical protein